MSFYNLLISFYPYLITSQWTKTIGFNETNWMKRTPCVYFQTTFPAQLGGELGESQTCSSEATRPRSGELLDFKPGKRVDIMV